MKPLSLFFLAAFLAGCSKDSNPVVIPPPPVMTGNWDYTAGAATGIMTLTENDGLLTGTLNLSSVSLSLSGTVTKALQVTLGYADPSGTLTISGTTNTQKNTFTGTLRLDDYSTTPTTVYTYSMSATKR